MPALSSTVRAGPLVRMELFAAVPAENHRGIGRRRGVLHRWDIHARLPGRLFCRLHGHLLLNRLALRLRRLCLRRSRLVLRRSLPGLRWDGHLNRWLWAGTAVCAAPQLAIDVRYIAADQHKQHKQFIEQAHDYIAQNSNAQARQ